MIEEALFWSVLIFFARLIDVSMGTMRTILIVRGRRGIASISAFFEIMVWLIAASRVLTQLDNWYYMIAYALGFAAGNFLGSYLEEKIALGYMFAYIIPKKRDLDLAHELRKAGFGVTVMYGKGLRGPEPVCNVLFRRRETKRLVDVIKKHDKGAFYTIMDVRAERGGYVPPARKGK